MPRKGSVSKRKIPFDSKYNDPVVSKFINCLMLDGKKSVAEKIFYDSLEILGNKKSKDSLEVFHEAVNNVKPSVEVRPRRVGGATYQVPMEVSSFRKQSLAIRWLLDAARGRSEKSMTGKLSSELLEASENKGGAIKKKEDTHRMAEANRAFAHYRW